MDNDARDYKPRAIGAPVAFLSYAHAEKTLALIFRDALGTQGLDVLMDVEDLKPGSDIAEFARRSVREADATICLVSTASLSSPWVVFEAVTTLQKAHSNPDARLIACATDQAFLAPDFLIGITRTIDSRLDALKRLIVEYLERNLDMADLQAERKRLLEMRGGLGDVLLRLRSSLTLTLSQETLDETAAAVAKHIASLRGRRAATLASPVAQANAGDEPPREMRGFFRRVPIRRFKP